MDNICNFRESMAAFDLLCDTFPDENCVLVNREILVEVCFTDLPACFKPVV